MVTHGRKYFMKIGGLCHIAWTGNKHSVELHIWKQRNIVSGPYACCFFTDIVSVCSGMYSINVRGYLLTMNLIKVNQNNAVDVLKLLWRWREVLNGVTPTSDVLCAVFCPTLSWTSLTWSCICLCCAAPSTLDRYTNHWELDKRNDKFISYTRSGFNNQFAHKLSRNEKMKIFIACDMLRLEMAVKVVLVKIMRSCTCGCLSFLQCFGHINVVSSSISET